MLDGGPVCAGPGAEVPRSRRRISVPLGGRPPGPRSAGRGDLMISGLRVEGRWRRETVMVTTKVTTAHTFWALSGTVGTSCVSSPSATRGGGRRCGLHLGDEDADHKTAKHCPPSHTGSGTQSLALESEFPPTRPTVPLWTQTEIFTGLSRPDPTLPLRRHRAGYIQASAGRVCARHPLAMWTVWALGPSRAPCFAPNTQSRQMGGGHRLGLGGQHRLEL